MREIFTVTAPGLNLHSDHRSTSHVLDQLTTGDQGEVIEHWQHWLKISVTHTRRGLSIGELGWVDGSFGDMKTVQEATDIPLPTEWPTEAKPNPGWIGAAVVVIMIIIGWLIFALTGSKP